jgi:hypothetical protein
MVAWLEQGLTAQHIYLDLVGEQGYVGNYYSVRRFFGSLQQATGLPVRRMEVRPV